MHRFDASASAKARSSSFVELVRGWHFKARMQHDACDATGLPSGNQLSGSPTRERACLRRAARDANAAAAPMPPMSAAHRARGRALPAANPHPPASADDARGSAPPATAGPSTPIAVGPSSAPAAFSPVVGSAPARHWPDTHPEPAAHRSPSSTTPLQSSSSRLHVSGLGSPGWHSSGSHVKLWRRQKPTPHSGRSPSSTRPSQSSSNKLQISSASG